MPESEITRQEFASLCSNQHLYKKPETRSVAIDMAVSGRIKDFVKSGPRRLEEAEEFVQDVRDAVNWLRPKIEQE